MAQREPGQRLLTFDEYAALPDDDYYRDELSRGRLVREPRPTAYHARVQLRIGQLIANWIDQAGIGYATVECGYKLEHDPDTLRGPDVAYVARPPESKAVAWPDYGPDLVVEILSPSDRASLIIEKMSQYFGAGTRVVWLVDTEERMVLIFRGLAEVRIVREHDILTGDDVLPGLSCKVSSIFP